ncbi:glycoside hydrolase family 43 protein [Sediminitomix flava]|uniref:Glycosyl hydrolase family 43 n=1 Tax=Sediminitomix flava TaxID=379075 RepID=A0A315YZL2_SEDFL|nr:family 43 glycosylhydrolase [Sediminitomix flava]PWJ35025.1 glycosyl hydrolase family 43 [Sediminitomix flava]
MKSAYQYISQFLLWGAVLASSCALHKEENQKIVWENPIREGINPYGMKDFFIYPEGESYYMVGTEYPDPFQATEGLQLYKADQFNTWKVAKLLIEKAKIPANAWYKDEWKAPEIHKIRGKYYLSFNGRNNTINPYKKHGFGLAVADKIDGLYQVLTSDAPLLECNNATLVEAADGSVYILYDMDGRIYSVELDIENAKLKAEPKELLGPSTLAKNYKYLDAPQVTKKGDTYHLLCSQFYGGYVVKVNHMTSKHPLGPWKWEADNPLYTFLEAEADLEVKMPYPTTHGYAPPTQVIFSNQLFRGKNDNYFIAYHSSEKYSEPYLCIEPVLMSGNQITIIQAKERKQKVALR